MREKQAADGLQTTIQEDVVLTGPAVVPESCSVQAMKMGEITLCAAHTTAVTRSLATSTAPEATR